MAIVNEVYRAVPTAEPPVRSVTITLSKDEAEAVLAVVGNVLGAPADTPRQYTDAVYDALTRVNGLKYNRFQANQRVTLRGA